MTKNTLYKPLDWQPDGDSLSTSLDESVYGLSELVITPITVTDLDIMVAYDEHIMPGDTVIFYAVWSDGEWQPRGCYPDFDTAKSDINIWWQTYTRELSERAAADEKARNEV